MRNSGTAAAFVETTQYRRFREFCDACRKYKYIGLCYGPPGVGKTLSARHYADWDKLTAFLERREHNGMKLPEVLHCDVMFFTASAAMANAPVKINRAIDELRDGLVKLRHLKIQEEEETALFAAHDHMVATHNAPRDPLLWWHQQRAAARQATDDFKVLSRRYVERCREVGDPTTLLIVDEVDLFRMTGLEQLRAIFDRGGIGMVLIGMPGLEKRLARYPQLYSRIGFVHEYKSLSREEMRHLLETSRWLADVPLPADDLANEDSIAAILRITGGNFRLLHRLLTQIGRVLEINRLNRVTVPVVEAARESLVIGMA